MKKTKAQYKTDDGKRCVGVTTVTSELGWNTRVLVAWSNRLGLQGINSASYTDDKAQIGTIGHGLVLEHHGGEKFDRADYSPKQVNQAENSLLSYLEWLKGKTLKPILLEKPLVSNEWEYGGTPDNYCELDGVKTLLDYKTGKKGIYPEHMIQVSAYKQLLQETGHIVEKVIILNIPRSEDESFQQKEVRKTEICWEIFKHALEIYKLKKEIY